MRFIIVLMILFTVFVFCSCDKMEDKENVQREMQQNNEQNQSPHSYQSEGDSEADRLMKEADVSYNEFEETRSDESREIAEKKSMDAAMYLMYDAQLPPKDKYKPALKYFRRVLKLDPGNEEAKLNKEKIEEIYEQMGKPIPETDT